MTPKNSISNGTLMLRADKESPIAAIRLPEIQTGLNPNLLTSPPTRRRNKSIVLMHILATRCHLCLKGKTFFLNISNPANSLYKGYNFE